MEILLFLLFIIKIELNTKKNVDCLNKIKLTSRDAKDLIRFNFFLDYLIQHSFLTTE